MSYKPKRAIAEPGPDPSSIKKNLSYLGIFAVGLALILGVSFWSALHSPTAHADHTPEHTASPDPTETPSEPSALEPVAELSLAKGEACGEVVFEYQTDPEDALVEVYRNVNEEGFQRQLRDPKRRTETFQEGDTVAYRVLVLAGDTYDIGPLVIEGCLEPTPTPTPTSPGGTPTATPTAQPSATSSATATATPTNRPSATATSTATSSAPGTPAKEYNGGLANTGQ